MDCQRCSSYRAFMNKDKKCMVHRCFKYPHITVFGLLQGKINPECTKADVNRQKPRMSLAERTFLMAGGKYDKNKEPSISNPPKSK